MSPQPRPGRAPSRVGHKQIAGFFPVEMSLALHMLVLRQDRSLQALMAEAFNAVLRKHGEARWATDAALRTYRPTAV